METGLGTAAYEEETKTSLGAGTHVADAATYSHTWQMVGLHSCKSPEPGTASSPRGSRHRVFRLHVEAFPQFLTLLQNSGIHSA